MPPAWGSRPGAVLLLALALRASIGVRPAAKVPVSPLTVEVQEEHHAVELTLYGSKYAFELPPEDKASKEFFSAEEKWHEVQGAAASSAPGCIGIVFLEPIVLKNNEGKFLSNTKIEAWNLGRTDGFCQYCLIQNSITSKVKKFVLFKAFDNEKNLGNYRGTNHYQTWRRNIQEYEENIIGLSASTSPLITKPSLTVQVTLGDRKYDFIATEKQHDFFSGEVWEEVDHAGATCNGTGIVSLELILPKRFDSVLAMTKTEASNSVNDKGFCHYYIFQNRNKSKLVLLEAFKSEAELNVLQGKGKKQFDNTHYMAWKRNTEALVEDITGLRALTHET